MNRPTIALLACLMTFQARADNWEFTISPYIWLPSLSLDSSDVDDGGDPGDDPSLEIGPIDYLDALDFTLMVSGDLRNKGWVVAADFLYVDFSIDDKDIDIGRPGTGPFASTYSAALSGSIVSLSGGRTISETGRSRVDGLIGVRLFNMALDLSGELDSGNASRPSGCRATSNTTTPFSRSTGAGHSATTVAGRCATTLTSAQAMPT